MKRVGIGIMSFLCLHGSLLMGYLQWDWSGVHLNDPLFLQNLQFPHTFIWGVGDSDFQTSGEQTEGDIPVQNNWTVYQAKHGKKPVGIAAGRWTRWKQDIDLIKQSGFSAYRCSIEWSKVEPIEGQFNQAVIEHYIQQCKYAQEQGIEVWVALWHHTWPVWFGEKDAFEKRENNELFIRYATKVVEALAPYVSKWITFNEPEGYTLGAYYMGDYPPEKKGDWQLAGEVLANMLSAHVKLYPIIKQLAPQSEVGFTKIVELIDPYHAPNSRNFLNYAAEYVPAKFFNKLMNNTILEFFRTGTFVWWIPGKANVVRTHENANDTLDYLGVNYYAHTKLSVPLDSWSMKALKPQPAIAPDDIVSDGNRIIYPEGMYRAIEMCACVGKPLYIAENGIADADDRVRDMYIKKHLYAVKKAMDEIKVMDKEVDIRGYFYWADMDCFEWKHEYKQAYGLYKVDFNDPALPRTLRESARSFVEFLQQRCIKS